MAPKEKKKFPNALAELPPLESFASAAITKHLRGIHSLSVLVLSCMSSLVHN